MKAVLASQNAHKLKEIQAILSGLGIEVVPESALGLDIDVDENGATFEANSHLKAEAVMRAANMPAIADDSGLMVDALDGAPGVHSARYGPKGHDGTDDERIAFLLENMKDVPDAARTARFVCVITCLWPDGREVVARGECRGRILHEKHGAGGFGYDPVFYLPEYGMTYAELPAEKKNEISHRGNALREFVRLYKEKHYDDK